MTSALNRALSAAREDRFALACFCLPRGVAEGQSSFTYKGDIVKCPMRRERVGVADGTRLRVCLDDLLVDANDSFESRI